MIQWLKGLMRPKNAPKGTVVLVDGDQGAAQLTSIYKKDKDITYHWVQNSKMNVPNVVKKNKKVRVHIPSDIGKEAVDTFIAMKTVFVCTAPTPPKEVYIVSSDLDFVDVIMNASSLFPHIKFTLMIKRHKNNCPAKRPAVTLPQNASLLFYRPRAS